MVVYMALVMQQEASIGEFNVYFSLNLCVFIEQLGARNRKHVITLHLYGKFKKGVALV